jgi:hypothetical protein
VSQLGEQPDRGTHGGGGIRSCAGRAHAVTTPLSASFCSMGMMSERMRSLGAL